MNFFFGSVSQLKSWCLCCDKPLSLLLAGGSFSVTSLTGEIIWKIRWLVGWTILKNFHHVCSLLAECSCLHPAPSHHDRNICYKHGVGDCIFQILNTCGDFESCRWWQTWLSPCPICIVQLRMCIPHCSMMLLSLYSHVHGTVTVGRQVPCAVEEGEYAPKCKFQPNNLFDLCCCTDLSRIDLW